MPAHDQQTNAELARDAEAARAIRARREAALSPSERLERVDQLCRELTAIRRVDQLQA